MKIIPVLHDISSAQRLLDMAKTVYALGYDVLVATRVYGAAAQNGVPEATRIALRMSKSFIPLPELRDAVELFKPDKVLTVSKEIGKPIDKDELLKTLEGCEKVLIVFGGSEPGLPKQDASLGTPIYIKGVEGRLSPVAEAAIILYWLKELRSL